MGATATAPALSSGSRGPYLAAFAAVELHLSHSFQIATFAGLLDLWPKHREGLSWPEVVAVIGSPRPSLRKGLKGDPPVPMFSAAVFEREKSIAAADKIDPTKARPLGAYIGVWDLDQLPTEEVHRVLKQLETEQQAYLYATSFSHGQPASELKAEKRPDPCPHCRAGGAVQPSQGNGTTWVCGHCNATWTTACARLVLPFSRLVKPDEWLTVWTATERRLLKGLSDQSSRSLVRRYFAPSYKEGGGAPPSYYGKWDSEAKLLDVNAILRTSAPIREAASTPTSAAATDAETAVLGQPLTRDQLQSVAKRLWKGGENSKALAAAVSALIKGESFAQSGNPGRHNTMYRIVCEIYDDFGLADPASVVAHFAPSLQIMQPTKTTPGEIFRIADGKFRERRVKHATQIAEAFGWKRHAPYTDEEIAATADAVGARLMEMPHRWVIQCGSSFYVLCGDKYWCYPRDSALSAIRRDLSPHRGIVLDVTGPKGSKPKSLEEIVRDYGAVAVSVEVDLASQRAYYDSERRVMVEAPCPVRVEAEYSAEVEEWLRLLAGPLAERLNQWLACVTMLRKPCVALYLEGGPDTGKSLFMAGVARVFSTGRPAELEGALGDFNEELLLNPIVVADERLPEDAKGQVRTDDIRKFVQGRERALNRKYKPPATIKGAARVIMAANNQDKLIHTDENLNDNDIKAIIERFLVIPARDEARVYLSTRREMVERWTANDTIAKHTVWLCENLHVEPYGRFLVRGEAKAMTDALTTSSGLRTRVCEWVMSFLAEPSTLLQQLRQDRHGRLAVRDGRLLISSKLLAKMWNVYLPERTSPPPTPSKVAKALALLSDEVTVRMPPHGKPTKMRSLNFERLTTWAADTGFDDVGTVPELVASLDKQLNGGSATTSTVN